MLLLQMIRLQMYKSMFNTLILLQMYKTEYLPVLWIIDQDLLQKVDRSVWTLMFPWYYCNVANVPCCTLQICSIDLQDLLQKKCMGQGWQQVSIIILIVASIFFIILTGVSIDNDGDNVQQFINMVTGFCPHIESKSGLRIFIAIWRIWNVMSRYSHCNAMQPQCKWLIVQCNVM